MGARVVKTCLAISISILIARSLNLYSPQFAGIISILAVQPSINRSIRYGIQQFISALVGAIAGAIAILAIGTSFLVMGLISFLIMLLHVKIRWTNSLLVSAVIAINTLGTKGLSFTNSAWNQIELVLIGIGVGTLINLIYKPVHQDRAEDYLFQSDGMLRALMYYLYLDLKSNKVTPYTAMNIQINQVKTHIEKGLEISRLVNEDLKFRNDSYKNTLILFHAFESMAERIRDMIKALQDATVTPATAHILYRLLCLVIHSQENMMHGKATHSNWVKDLLDRQKNLLWKSNDKTVDFQHKLAVYNFFGYLAEYLRLLDSLHVSTLKGNWKKERSIVDKTALAKRFRFN